MTFFHAVVTERRMKSVIHRIQKSNREWVDDETSICAEAVSFFQDLFTEEGSRPSSEMLEIIPTILTEQDNMELTEVPSLNEVKKVIFSMDGDSAAGPDGFTGKFFTEAWEVVAEDVHRAIMSFFCGAMLPRSVTATAIVSLTKAQCPQDFTQCRLISLCNFVNKVFLIQVLRHFGFSELWIDMVWLLISNVWFSVIVNGLPHGFFKSTRGLRQGDQISPALFVIGAEILSQALNPLAGHCSFRPFKIPSSCPLVTHLAYADDERP
ncbi:uncharacterized protein [Coffea arabica]|uniref:Reverse transcriptase domain-containing protein n=1 Tax=Coffea arabica TaxID=13443 RepID=A0ABM4W8B8_COFAR